MNDRHILNGIFWVLNSSAACRDLPVAARFGGSKRIAKSGFCYVPKGYQLRAVVPAIEFFGRVEAYSGAGNVGLRIKLYLNHLIDEVVLSREVVEHDIEVVARLFR
jgi:hypothetical protein